MRDLKKKTFKDDTGRVLNLKWGGENRFTDKTIDMHPIFYGGAIRNNTQNVAGMHKAIWAVFFHNSATDEVHDHSYCPSGEDSWCKYSSASSKNLPPPAHKPPRIPVDLAPFVKPVFEDLSKPQLLEKCIDGAAQNQNESFNNILWYRCPKTGFCSLVTVEAALGLAILTYNHGFVVLSPLLEKLLGAHPVAFTSKYLESQDSKRVVKAVLKAESTNKRRRQAVTLENRSLEEECIADEGVTYQAGGF